MSMHQGLASGTRSFRAAVMPAPNADIEIRDYPRPKLAAGEVLMRTLYSEVCGTDVHIQEGRLQGVPYPIIPGHFSVGTVEEVCGSVTSVLGRAVQPGDMVTFLDVHRTCHRCWQCQVAKTPTRCPSRKVYGVTHSATEGPLGGWSEIVLLQNDVAIAHIPDGLSPLRFISGGCAMPTAIHAVERGGVALGDLVVVQGAGPVGICAAIAARQSGAEVFVCDMAPLRLEAARRMGFNVLDLAGDADRPSALLAEVAGGRLADVVIEATGVSSAIPAGVAMTRDGGRYVVVGHYADSGETRLNPHLDINRKHLDIRGTWGIEYSHFHKAIGLLDSLTAVGGDVLFEDVMVSTYSLDEVQQALDAVRDRRVVKAVISLQSKGKAV
ncbi:TPA: zinc-binding dehydrogenase [Pseudomonas aeruginosa]|nr:zinc-binding dehydrogenase [Pseudomonas aeruginosa]HCH7803259.1 zinc-binding dehydrogenase [Pseudomonas aeruginosa]HCI4168658.1 zinc-binding dehydrogenase [Pseudomonas aeruginosa]HCI7165063.1 zinc-binding dehydrogenase [Pseudomonas aeruginosa]HCJ0752259.1 zinc-binding dehydrogenase [Pseudomonas aeruginosa]